VDKIPNIATKVCRLGSRASFERKIHNSLLDYRMMLFFGQNKRDFILSNFGIQLDHEF
jgi:hypothetical protein